MKCTIIYGFGSNMKHKKTLPAAEAFAMIPKLIGYLFIDIYHDGRLVYSKNAPTGYCDDCPYSK